MKRKDIRIRLAKNDDGDAVALLMKKLDFFQWSDWAIDWHDLEPNWLVAEVNGTVVGAIQVIPARPIGRMEILTVDPDLSLMMRGAVVLKLTDQAAATCRLYGSQAVSSLIPYSYPVYLGEAQNRQWVDLDDGTIIMKRLV